MVVTTLKIEELFNIEKGTLQSYKCIAGEYNFITAAEEWKTHKEFAYDCEALIFAAAASGSLGRTHYVNGKFISSDLCFILTPKSNKTYPINLKFYHFVFNQLREEIVKNTKTGTSKEAINRKNFSQYKIPYFEISQQQFYIYKLISTQDNKKILVAEISYQQTLLKKLRQAILQEAIQGKLTVDWRKENPNVEPASELLKRIQAEKEKLITEKKIKPQKPLPPIKAEEIPFELPKGWVWCRLGVLVESFQNGISKRRGGGNGVDVIVLRLADIKNHLICLNNIRNLTLGTKELNKFKIENDDILVTRVNGSVDIVGNFNYCNNISLRNIAYCDHLIRMRVFFKKTVASYLFLVEKTSLIRDRVKSEFKTTSGQKTINQGHLSNFFIPLPPLTEQKAIVAKVEKLLTYCDELEQQIQQTKTYSEQLMQTVLKEAFTP